MTCLALGLLWILCTGPWVTALGCGQASWKTAQKRHEGSDYELQSAQRLMYSVIIDTVCTRIWDTEDRGNSSAEDSNDNLVNTNAIYQGTKKSLTDVFVESNQASNSSAVWNWVGYQNTQWFLETFTPELVKFLCDSFKEHETIHFCTEYRCDVHKFRCHPSIQSDGGIHDWMNIDFGRNMAIFLVGWLLLLLWTHLPNLTRSANFLCNPPQKIHKHESTLLREWEWSPDYLLVSGNTVVGPALWFLSHTIAPKFLKPNHVKNGLTNSHSCCNRIWFNSNVFVSIGAYR
jgi:hypothetical protein